MGRSAARQGQAAATRGDGELLAQTLIGPASSKRAIRATAQRSNSARTGRRVGGFAQKERSAAGHAGAVGIACEESPPPAGACSDPANDRPVERTTRLSPRGRQSAPDLSTTRSQRSTTAGRTSPPARLLKQFERSGDPKPDCWDHAAPAISTSPVTPAVAAASGPGGSGAEAAIWWLVWRQTGTLSGGSPST